MTELKKDSQERVCFVILLPPNEAKAAYLVSSIKDDRKNIPQKRSMINDLFCFYLYSITEIFTFSHLNNLRFLNFFFHLLNRVPLLIYYVS